MNQYAVLGVEQSTSKDDIKRAYKRLAMKHHPDKEGGDADRFKEVNEAYAILSDDENRCSYDASLSLKSDPVSHMFGEGFPGMGFFTGMGMGGGVGVGTGSGHQNRARGDHMHVLNVSLAEAFTGVSRTLKVNVQKQCSKCISCKPCSGCLGTGVHRQTHAIGHFRQTVSITCAACGGKGMVACASACGVTCPDCNNSRVCNVEHVLTIGVSPGTQSGHHERFNGLGEQAVMPSDLPGDLIVEIKVCDDATFTRHGDDLHMSVSISLWESIIGKVIVVPMFCGDLAFNTSDMDNGIVQPGRRYVLSDFGMPMCIGPKGKRGALILLFTLTYPTQRLAAHDKASLKDIVTRMNSRN